MSKYKKWYDSIIKNAQGRVLSGYVEVHHIIPRSLGGTDQRENLVQLTAREHFLCHVLLTKFTTGQDRYKMLHAAIVMKAESKGQKRKVNSRLYETLKKEYSKAKRGINHSWNTGLTKDSSEKLKETGKSISKALSGFRHWTNGVESIKAKECPGEGWRIGRAPNDKFKLSEERRKEMIQRMSNGEASWWNDGTLNKRSKESPGPEWVRGRIMSPELYTSFCKKNKPSDS